MLAYTAYNVNGRDPLNPHCLELYRQPASNPLGHRCYGCEGGTPAGLAATYATTSTIKSTTENNAGTGKMKRQAITPVASVARANTAIIGRTAAELVPASRASCQSSTVCASIMMLMDQPNPMKKSR